MVARRPVSVAVEQRGSVQATTGIASTVMSPMIAAGSFLIVTGWIATLIT